MEKETRKQRAIREKERIDKILSERLDSNEEPQPFTQADWDYINREFAARIEARRKSVAPAAVDHASAPGCSDQRAGGDGQNEALIASLRRRIECARRGEVMSLEELFDFLELSQEDKEERQGD